MENSQSKALTSGEAKTKYPELAGLLEALSDDTPLTMAELADRYAPGRLLDRLGACAVILNYLRTDK
ncbi:MAG: hypothetical protein JRI95_05070 [Deltaproteobacteria bacterium]|nr:hypothetical protein [Deltaproteobacteria bacterium]MBW2086039.1 hypothetical protein [Deltaproteobacteria bacterium]